MKNRKKWLHRTAAIALAAVLAGNAVDFSVFAQNQDTGAEAQMLSEPQPQEQTTNEAGDVQTDETVTEPESETSVPETELSDMVTIDSTEYALVLGGNVESPEITDDTEENDTGDFTVTGGSLGTDYTYADGVLTVLTGTSLTIRNTDAGTATTDRIYVNGGGNITLAGVNIDVSGIDSTAAFEIASGSVTITLADGTANILKSGVNCAGLQTDSRDGLTITGGGSLEAAGGNYGAGIGGGNGMAGRNITIRGGTVTAIAGTLGGAGIGGGEGGAGENVTITGGTVYAAGGYDDGGAGIGGGNDKTARYITITGGTVTARSGMVGAGIGGGEFGAGEYITISGGTVTAIGRGGAGIGGGVSGTGRYITISGGVVTAESDSGAGIGGGYKKVGEDIVISGGFVTAKGNLGAGVGAGHSHVSQGSFSTGENGSAFLIASSNRISSITDNDDKSGWSGIIFEGSSGAVYGDITLPAGSYTVPDGSALTIPMGSSLGGEGVLTGNGTFQNENLTEDMVSVPEDLIYGGEDLTETIAEQLLLPEGKEICGQTFSYCWTAQVEKITDLEYQVTYTSQYNSENTFTKSVTADLAVGVSIDGGETEYFTSIEAAWEAAQGNTAVVMLFADVQASATLTVTSGSDITLTSRTDSSGNTYTLSGNVYNASSGLINVTSGATFTLESGTAENGAGGNNAIAVNGGHFVLSGGTVLATADGHSSVCVYNRGTAEIRTGNVRGDIGVAAASDGSTITILDGNIEGRARGVYVSGSGAKITIKGGSISASNTEEKNGADGAALRIERTGSALLSGGTYSGAYSISIHSGNSVTLKELLDVSGDVKYAYYSNGALVTEGLDGKTRTGLLTVDECEHSYSTWTDKEDGENHIGTCVVCGHEETEPHDWDTDGRCKANGCTAQATAYTITIPATATAGGDAVSIGVNTEEPFNLNGGTVSVSVSDGIDENGKLTLTNTDGSGSVVTSEMYVGETPITAFADKIFATFTSAEVSPVSLSFKEPTETDASAGTYEGIVTFSIEYTAKGGTTE